MINTANISFSIDDLTFEKRIINSSKPSIVLFRAKWSGNAHLQETVLLNLPTRYAKLINFYTVDIDDAAKLTQKFNIQVVPTLLFFKKENLEAFLPGLFSQRDIEKVIKQVLRKKY